MYHLGWIHVCVCTCKLWMVFFSCRYSEIFSYTASLCSSTFLRNKHQVTKFLWVSIFIKRRLLNISTFNHSTLHKQRKEKQLDRRNRNRRSKLSSHWPIGVFRYTGLMNAANSRINIINDSRDVYRSMYPNPNSLCTDTRCVSYCKSLFRTSLMKFSYCKTFWSTLALASALEGGDMFATSALNPDFRWRLKPKRWTRGQTKSSVPLPVRLVFI